MRWALFTDFHTGRPESKAQQTAYSELLDFVAGETDGRYDAVVLAGDIAYSGEAGQYEHFAKTFLKPLRSIPAFRDACVLAVPGNHDVACDEADPIVWEHIGKNRQKDYFDESATGRKRRAPRAAAFQPFELFATEESLVVPAPSKVVSLEHVLAGHNRIVRFVLVNTAFFCDPHENHDKNFPAPTASLRSTLEASRDSSTQTLVIGHHPIESFSEDQRDHLKSLLTKHAAVYVHGHLHDVRATHGKDALLSLGFGAAYPRGLDESGDETYTNSFALCEIDNDLAIKFFSWNRYGNWSLTNALPTEFGEPSEDGRFHLTMPGRRPRRARRKTKRAMASQRPPERRGPGCESVIFLQRADAELFARSYLRRLLPQEASLNDLRILAKTPSLLEAQFPGKAGPARVRVVTAPGQLLMQSDVEAANTQIDYEGLSAFYIISAGSLADDAQSSYDRLRSRKPISIVAGVGLAETLLGLLSERARRQLETLDAAVVLADVVVSPGALYILVRERASDRWFYVINESGAILDEASEIVVAIREHRPTLKKSGYGAVSSADSGPTSGRPPRFDETSYRAKCLKEFNNVRYAALASTGFRFSSITLKELYIQATASEDSAAEAAISRAIDDAMQILEFPEELRGQLEHHIRSMLSTGRRGATSDARELYKRYGTLMVLGDPGSGKTCFAKSELLSYCGESRGPWYARHVPIFVSLSELAELVPAAEPDTDVFALISTLCARRGLALPRDVLEELASSGRAAFFFDGLDEVTTLEKRATIFGWVSEQVSLAAANGNRVVVTSRPASITLLSLPSTLRTVVLRGLSQGEIRELAKRVLAARLADGGSAVRLDEAPTRPGDAALIDRIVDDCSRIPGLQGIARNPLLLTLLIMIYANMGAPAAKRHRVYQQAISTLSTVRGRDSGHTPFSEADLRRRLGAVALAVCNDPTATVPRWNEAVAAVREVIAGERGMRIADVSVTEVEDFFMRVGDGTGLVIPDPKPDTAGGGTLTFMHHSFLEYYAAVGLFASRAQPQEVAALARLPKWREVVSLYSGLLADQDDATEFIRALVSNTKPVETSTLDRLQFAFDCALEADVPAETVCAVLVDGVRAAEGTLRRDSRLAGVIGEALDRVYDAGRHAEVLALVVAGLRSRDAGTCASYLTILGRIASDWREIPSELAGVFEEAAARTEAVVSIALCEALALAPALRTSQALAHFKRCFGRSNRAKYAAVRAAGISSELARLVWPRLVEVLDKQAYLAVTAANAVLRAGWKIDLERGPRRAEVERALRCLLQFGREEHVAGIGKAVLARDVERLLEAGSTEERTLGLCFVPWVRDNTHFVYDRLMPIVRSSGGDHARQVLALDALRLSTPTRQLLRVSDRDAIYRLLEADTRDVRLAAARLVSQLGADQQSVDALLSYAIRTERIGKEYRFALRALGDLPATPEEVRSYAEDQVIARVRSRNQSDDARRELLELMQLIEMSEEFSEDRLVVVLRQLVLDVSWKGDVRGAALECLAWVWRPSEASVKFLLRIAEPSSSSLHAAFPDALDMFSRRCGQSIEFVRSVEPRLNDLIAAALSVADGASGTPLSNHGFETLRIALAEILKIQDAYLEFAARVT